MANRRNVLPGEEFSDGELASLFAGFEKMVENPNICNLEEIDLSKAGWEVILHFDDKDPSEISSTAARDYWKLEEWSAIGMFQMDYQPAPNTVVILKYDENCGSDKFTTEQITLFKKYRPMACAAMSGRRLPDSGTKEKVEATLSGINKSSAEEVYEIVNPDDEGVSLVELELLNKIFELDFEVLALKLSVSTDGLEAILKKLQEIADDEELDINIERAYQPVEVYISKKDDVLYRKTLDVESFQYLKRFDFTLVC